MESSICYVVKKIVHRNVVNVEGKKEVDECA